MNLADCLKLIHKGTQPEFHLPAEVIDRIDRDQEIATNKLIKSGVAQAVARKQGAQAVVQKYLDTTRKDLAAVQKAIPAQITQPLIGYHGGKTAITKFEKSKVGSNTGEGWLGDGFYFSPDESVAPSYGPVTTAVSINLKNPFRFPPDVNPIKFVQEKGGPKAFTEWVKAQGHDGVISDRVLKQIVAFEPEQLGVIPPTTSQPSEQSGLGAGAATVTEQSGQAKPAPAETPAVVARNPRELTPDEFDASVKAINQKRSSEMSPSDIAPSDEIIEVLENVTQPPPEMGGMGPDAKTKQMLIDAGYVEKAKAKHGRLTEKGRDALGQLKLGIGSLKEKSFALQDDIASEFPVRVVDVESYKLSLPKGYVREGDRYVFKPPQASLQSSLPENLRSSPEVEAAIAPKRVTNQSIALGELVGAAQEAKWTRQESAEARLIRTTDTDLASMSATELDDFHADLTRGLGTPYPNKDVLIRQIKAIRQPAKAMATKDFSQGGAIFGAGGGKTITRPAGTTPKGSANFIRVESAPKRLFKGLFTEGSADVLAKSKNPIGKVLSQSIKRHVDLEQEINGQLVSELDRATKGFTKQGVKKAIAELEPYLAAKENKRTLPVLGKEARSLLTAWENIAEKTGLMAEAHNVQVFDQATGKYRSMHRMGRAYVPRVFRPEVQRVLSDPRTNSKLFNDLVDSLATHRGITADEAATELRGVAGRFQSSDFLGNLEMARTGQLPEIFYDYNLGNIAARFIPSFSERMSQIISYGQRLGPRDAPLRENLWDVAIKEAEDSYTQQWLRSAEDQSANLKTAGGAQKAAQQAQTLASGLLLSSPTTSVIRNTLSGLTSTVELLGVRRSLATVIQAATNGQTKLDDLIRGITNTTLKYSLYNGSEGFVRTHAAATASQFAKDGIAAIRKDPKSRAAKEALALFKRSNADAARIVAENADWKTGPETRKFVRGVIRESQGGYRFDQVPLWANSAVGRFFYQFGRWGTQRARNIWKNGIKPLVGEDVEWNGKTMTHRNPVPLLKMAIGSALLGEAYALVASMIFDRDRKDASLDEIRQAFSEDQKKAIALAAERIINDVIMSGMMGVWGQPVDFVKSLKDQSRFKNPAEPPGLGSTKALGTFLQSALDQQGEVTTRDVMELAGGITPGAKQLTDLARNVLDEPLYEAENDVRTLRAAASRWAADSNMDVPKRAASQLRKSASAPIYEPIQSALLVGDARRAAFLAAKFRSESGDQKKALEALKSSVKGRQPFRVGPFTSDEHKVGFMIWARKHLSPADFKQSSRVQYRYEAAAKSAGLW